MKQTDFLSSKAFKSFGFKKNNDTKIDNIEEKSNENFSSLENAGLSV